MATQDNGLPFEPKKRLDKRLTDLSETKGRINSPKNAGAKICTQNPEVTDKTHLAENKRPNSSTRNEATQKSNLHLRYWTYLFDNLHRSIDEIFCACESEENLSSCHETLRTMEVYSRDFEMLIKRIETQRTFECATNQDTKPPLVWEVRASPPRTNCPVTLVLPEEEPRPVSSLAKKSRSPKRRIDFKIDQLDQSTGPLLTENNCDGGTTSWADMVRNGHQRPNINADSTQRRSNIISMEDDTTSKDEVDRLNNASKDTSDSNRVHELRHDTKLSIEGTTQASPDYEQLSVYSSNIVSGDSFVETSKVTGAANMKDDEGWEVVSRSRGRKGSNKVQPVMITTSVIIDNSISNDQATIHKDDQYHFDVSQLKNDPDCIHVTPNCQGKDPSHGSNIDVDSDYHGDVDLDDVGYVEQCHGRDDWQYQSNADIVDEHNDQDTLLLKGVDTSSNIDRAVSPYVQVFLSDESTEVDTSSTGVGKSLLSQSWPERSSSFLEACSTRRTPQKLTSPQRKRPTSDSKRMLDEKLAKIKLQRDKPQDMIQKSHIIMKDVQSDDITEQRRALIEEKLQRAEMKRVSLLQEKVKKAQEEEAKLNEIVFINTLEAQNKKIEVLARHQGHEARLQDIQEERLRKKEEQQAKEEAAQERRRNIEAEKLAKLLELDQKRRGKDARVEQKILEREKAREEAAKEKQRERERKLEARNEAITLSKVELEKKIQLKQDESSKRYDMQLEQRKEKAAVTSRHVSPEDAPRVTPYERKKWCSACGIKIISELYLLSHLRGKRHQEAVASLPNDQSDPSLLISEIPEEQITDEITMETAIAERIKAGKKRAKKLKQRVTIRTKEYESVAGQTKQVIQQSKARIRLQKLLRDINKLVESNGAGIWDSADVQHLDRILGELKRSFVPQSNEVRLLFTHLSGLDTLLSLLVLYNNEAPVRCLPIPYKSFQLASTVMGLICGGSVDSSKKFVLSGFFVPIIDTLSHNLSLQIPSVYRLSSSWGGDGARPIATSDQLQYICGPLLSLLAKTLSSVAQSKLEPVMEQALHDLIGYMVCSGLIDQLYAYFSMVYGPLDDCHSAQLVLDMLNVLVVSTALFHYKVKDVFSDKLLIDPTQLVDAMQRTELVGIASLLYAILLHSGPPRHSTVPPALSTYTISVSTAAVKCINNVALMNIKWFQRCLGAEGISLQFRHTASYLLWHCSHHSHEVLLDEVMLAIGYFCVLNSDNQVFLQSGRSPTVLQLLCALPLDYFTTPRLVNLLFPTLISICYNNEANVAILCKEVHCEILCKYIQDQIDGAERSKDLKCLSDLQYRFPTEHWKNSLLFFKQNH